MMDGSPYQMNATMNTKRETSRMYYVWFKHMILATFEHKKKQQNFRQAGQAH